MVLMPCGFEYSVKIGREYHFHKHQMSFEDDFLEGSEWNVNIACLACFSVL